MKKIKKRKKKNYQSFERWASIKSKWSKQIPITYKGRVVKALKLQNLWKPPTKIYIDEWTVNPKFVDDEIFSKK